MDDSNNGITIGDIARLKDNPGNFKWAYWNGKIDPLVDPVETIKDSKVLLYRPELIMVDNTVLKKQWLGYDDFGTFMHGDDKVHEDYVMCAVLGDANGYVAYRTYPPNSFILDDIYVQVHLPHSEGRFSGFKDHTKTGVTEDSVNIPMEQRTRTLDKFIEDLGGRWSEEPLVFEEGENLSITTASAEVDHLVSGVAFNQISQVPSMKEYYDSILYGEYTAKQLLKVFKMLLDEFGIAYRR